MPENRALIISETLSAKSTPEFVNEYRRTPEDDLYGVGCNHVELRKALMLEKTSQFFQLRGELRGLRWGERRRQLADAAFGACSDAAEREGRPQSDAISHALLHATRRVSPTVPSRFPPPTASAGLRICRSATSLECHYGVCACCGSAA